MSSLSAIAATAIVLILAYLIGSTSFAVLVSKSMGLRDPRSFGSGNPGATNVLRSGNKTAAILTLLGDTAKGWAAVVLAAWAAGAGLAPEAAVPWAGLAAFLGHLYPVFLRFKGGKGVATALGVLLALQPWLAVATMATWGIVLYVTRYVSLASIAAAVFAPCYYILGGKVAWRMDAMTTVVIAALAVLLIVRHKANILRLLAGKENRLGRKK
ncbi:glycerol-3-phosphate 1-O-acyltransferase PlsY [Castellaniella sp. GW247-6E4]|uniref:glycerol-3-phosphate 1-O-acyltransferase PlsY n=1 Tax=Castellaniella sp. GW247-6E4 TaxID=3140380 RepID=UPI00331512C0